MDRYRTAIQQMLTGQMMCSNVFIANTDNMVIIYEWTHDRRARPQLDNPACKVCACMYDSLLWSLLEALRWWHDRVAGKLNTKNKMNRRERESKRVAADDGHNMWWGIPCGGLMISHSHNLQMTSEPPSSWCSWADVIYLIQPSSLELRRTNRFDGIHDGDIGVERERERNRQTRLVSHSCWSSQHFCYVTVAKKNTNISELLY